MIANITARETLISLFRKLGSLHWRTVGPFSAVEGNWVQDIDGMGLEKTKCWIKDLARLAGLTATNSS
jgi:hypothetical protein